jgi:hypothetical protein
MHEMFLMPRKVMETRLKSIGREASNCCQDFFAVFLRQA